MDTSFFENIYHIATASHVPFVREGWPLLVLAVVFFWLFMGSDAKAKKYGREHDAQVRKIARMEMKNQRRQRARR